MSVYRRRLLGGCVASGAAILIAVAIVGQLVFSLSLGPADTGVFLINFFSFFTILSNALAVIALVLCAVLQLRGATAPTPGALPNPAPVPGWFVVAFAAVTTYMLTTGIVYNALLRGVSLDQESTLIWSNEVLHLIGPILVVAVWFISPYRVALGWNHLAVAAAFPVLWAGYTMIRGEVVGWYPYPFLNPAQPGGYGAVAAYLVGIAAAIIALDALIVWASRWRGAERRVP